MSSYSKLYNPGCQKYSCPIWKYCGGRTARQVFHNPLGLESDPVDILFLGDHPNYKEIETRTPFSGSDGLILKNVVKKYAESMGLKVAYSYVVRGWPVDPMSVPDKFRDTNLWFMRREIASNARTKPLTVHPSSDAIIQHCSEHWQRDIADTKPKMIVAMGATTIKALFPDIQKTSIAQLEDTVMHYNGIPVRFTSSPYFLMRNPSSRPSWEGQIKRIVTGKIKAEMSDFTPKIHLLQTLDEAMDFLHKLDDFNAPVALDTETKNLNKKYGNMMATVQFSLDQDSAHVIPWLHGQSPFLEHERTEIGKKMKDTFLKRNKIKYWIGHNIKFENHVLKQTLGTAIYSAPYFDTQAGAFLLDENRTSRPQDFKYGIYSLKQLALCLLGFDGYNRGILEHRSSGSLFDIDLDSLAEYGGLDTAITYRLHDAELEEAKAQNYSFQLINLMMNLYTPMIRMFSEVEHTGMPADLRQLRTLISKRSPLLKELKKIEHQFKTNPNAVKANDILLARETGSQGYGTPGYIQPLGSKPWIFDTNRPGHGQALFFDVMKLEPTSIGKSGLPSIGKEFQDTYADRFEEVKWLKQRNEIDKMYSAFAKPLYNYIAPDGDKIDCRTDQRIRPNFKVSTVVTGRIACADPNLQQIPRGDSPIKKAIKNVFTAVDGNVMIQLDFAANEVRWVGILAQDQKMAENFIKAKEAMDDYRKNPDPEKLKYAQLLSDIHKQNGANMFGVSLEEVTKDQRQAAKAVTFALLYDSSEFSVAQSTGKSLEEVQGWFNKFYTTYPGIKEWKLKMKADASNIGYVETPHGRRRRFPIFDLFRDEYGRFIEESVPKEYQSKTAEALRQSSNAPVQGIASDASMIASYLFQDYIRVNEKPWMINNAVHDSCIFQVPKEDFDEAVRVSEQCFTTDLQAFMEGAFDINFLLPLGIDYDFGYKWGELAGWDFSPENMVEHKLKLELPMNDTDRMYMNRMFERGDLSQEQVALAI